MCNRFVHVQVRTASTARTAHPVCTLPPPAATRDLDRPALPWCSDKIDVASVTEDLPAWAIMRSGRRASRRMTLLVRLQASRAPGATTVLMASTALTVRSSPHRRAFLDTEIDSFRQAFACSSSRSVHRCGCRAYAPGLASVACLFAAVLHTTVLTVATCRHARQRRQGRR